LCVIAFTIWITNDVDESALEHLESLTASGIDFEIRSASQPENIELVLLMLEYTLHNAAHFELAESVLNLVLVAHGDVIAPNSDLMQLLEKVKQLHISCWDKSQTLFHHTLCLLQYFTGVK